MAPGRSAPEQRAVRVPPGIVALIDARSTAWRGRSRGPPDRICHRPRVLPRSSRSISAADVRSPVDESIDGLSSATSSGRTDSSFLDDDAFRFDHALIHDGAYRSLLNVSAPSSTSASAARSNRSQHLASQSSRRSSATTSSRPLHLAQLGPVDEHGRVVSEAASARFANAGRGVLPRRQPGGGDLSSALRRSCRSRRGAGSRSCSTSPKPPPTSASLSVPVPPRVRLWPAPRVGDDLVVAMLSSSRCSCATRSPCR